MEDYDAKLGIYSKDNIVTDGLVTKFKEKYLDVLVFDNVKKVDLTKLSYLVINLLDETSISFTNIISDLKVMVGAVECKIVVLLSKYIKEEEKYVYEANIQTLQDTNPNIGIILAPEILGNAVKYNENYISHNLIMQSIVSERIKTKNIVSLINTISVNKLVERVVRETFSFGISGQKLSLVGPRKGVRTFITKYLKIEESNIIFQKGESTMSEIGHGVTSKVDFSLRLAVNATWNSFRSGIKEEDLPTVLPQKQLLEPEIIIQNQRRPKNSIKAKFISRIWTILIGSFVVFASPFVLMFTTLLLFFTATKLVLSNSSFSEKLTNFSLKTIVFTQKVNLGVPFYYNYSNITYKTIFIFSEVFELSKLGSTVATRIMGDESYDLAPYSDSASAILDRVHTDIGFLQGDLNDLNDFVGKRLKQYLSNKNIDIRDYKNKVYFVRNFTSRLSTLLGVEKQVKYLVLFQNNMELRPTGGFIGSFAIITFDKGRLTGIDVNDVYTADGQLKGHVDPPEAIRQHLGEGGWFMRDSNWDPSFPESAGKAEWFLDKEINIKVDGVIAIDLFFVQKLLNVTGPLHLVDFDKTITAENLYLNTQSEVESNFFPGSIKKASFMTSLSKELITSLESLPKEKYVSLLKEVYSALEGRHVQLFFHDANSQESITNLGYSGSIDMTTECGLRCFSDKYSLIDANVGVNKANYFIKRSQELKLAVSKNDIWHELQVTYQNMASQAVGNTGVYKSYTRLLVPLGAKVTGVRLYNTSGSYEDLLFDKIDLEDRQEIGFLLNILPGDSKRVQVVWNMKTDIFLNGGEYRILARKQAGTDSDPLTVSMEKTDLSLTGRAPAVYTTTLSRDFNTRLFFKP